MSRHRIVRTMDYKDEYDGYDDVYGHSVEEDSCVSPSDAHWVYDRNRKGQGMTGYFDTDIQEEDEEIDSKGDRKTRRDSENFKIPPLSDIDSARLRSCMDEIRNVLGDSVSEKLLVETVIENDFDVTKSLDILLNNGTAEEELNQRAKLNQDLKDLNSVNKKPMTLSELISQRSVISNFPSSKTNLNPSISPKFTSLAELTSFHLNNTNISNTSDGLKSQFIIPKFNLGNNINVNSPPKFEDNPYKKSLDEIIKRKESLSSNSVSKATTSSLNSNSWVIDLSTALRTADSETVKNNYDISLREQEKFIPQFVDCEEDMEIDERIFDCSLDISKKLTVNLCIKKNVCSPFGRIICRKYKSFYLPRVKHEFKSRFSSQIKCFDFETPSPDDIVARSSIRRK